MKYLLGLIAGAVLASASAASASTVSIANAVPVAGANAAYQDNGFVWQNQGGYGSDCHVQTGPRMAVLYTLDNLYSHESCGNGSLGFARKDGATFSVSSVKVNAQDLTTITPNKPSPTGGSRFIETTSFDPYQNIDSAGIDVTNPLAIDAYVQAEYARQNALAASYQAWLYSSTAAPKTDRFYVAGLSGGSEIVRQYFADTGGMASLNLSGFKNIDQLVFGYKTGNFLWDEYADDYGGYTVLPSNSLWCAFNCEDFRIAGFNFSLNSAVAAVPVPAGGAMLLAGLGLLGWRSRKAV